MRRRLLIAIPVLLSVLAAVSLAACSTQSTPAPCAISTAPSPVGTGLVWPMLGHDPQRTGTSPYTGPVDPVQLWSAAIGQHLGSSPAVGPDGTVYVGGGNKLYAVGADGAAKWSFQTGGAVESSPTLAADGTVYVGMMRGDTPGHIRGSLFAVRPNGRQKWEYDAGAWVQSSPAVADDGTIYVCSGDGKLHALAPDGRQKWVYDSGGGLWRSSPALGPDDTIYFVAEFFPNASKLLAVTRRGKLRWTFTAKVGTDDTPAIGPDGTIYVLDDYGRILHAVGPDGVERWALDFGRPAANASSPQPKPPAQVAFSPAIDADGAICVGCTDGRVYGLTADGEQRWQVDLGSDIAGSPTVGADGTIYIVGDGLYALRPNGSPLWAALDGGDYTGSLFGPSSPIIGRSGTVYVCDHDRLIAVGERP